MGNHLKGMSGLVALASALLLAPAAPAQAKGRHILAGAVAGVAAYKLMEARHDRQERKRADAAAGVAPKPSPMGQPFDDESRARLARAKAEVQSERQASGRAGEAGFAEQFKERLAASRAKAREAASNDGPTPGQ